MASSLSLDIGAVDMDFSAALVPKPAYLLVLHDFHARSPDELTLRKGERVELLLDDSEYGDGWYLGRSLTSNEKGLFPEVYTTAIIVQEDAPGRAAQPPTLSTGIQDGTTVSSLSSSPVPQGASGASNTSPLIVDKAGKGRTSGIIMDRTVSLVEDTGAAAMPPPNFGRPAVVEDTLSDIEEAISEISSRNKIIKNYNSRHPQAPARVPEQIPQELPDSGSEYSRDHDQIDSESEDEDDIPAHIYSSSEITYTVDEVSRWVPSAVADYLRSRGVSPTTCDKFEEQEVTGAILIQLQMADLKELDLGSFGKRFEAWKEIENLVQNLQATPSRGGSSVRLSIASKESSPRPRSSTVGTGILPRIHSQHNRPASRQNIPRHRIDVQGANALLSSGMQPPDTAHTFITESPMSAMFERPRSPPESPPHIQHRQASGSSRDFSSSYSTSRGLQAALAAGASILAAGGAGGNVPHRRESSFDRNWKLNTVVQQNRPSTSAGSATHRANTSSGTTDSFTGDSGFGGSNSATPMATEKSYFSGAESSTSKGRKVLQKKKSTGAGNGQRKASYTEEQRVRAGTALSRHSRIGSTDTIRGDSSSSLVPQAKDKIRPKSNSFSDSGSYSFEHPMFSSSPITTVPTKKGMSDPKQPTPSSIVTRSASDKVGTPAIVSPLITSPMSANAIHDVLHTKSTVSVTIEGGVKSEKDKERTSEGHSYKAAASPSELRKKSKKHNTSAWQEGLRSVTPLEAAKEADFSGWMWKRGSGGMPSWGVRFFVLNGRRLSYFYNEDDTKERGLIDITSHKVLAATGDRIVNFHASLAAATKISSPASTATSPQFFQGLESPRHNGEVSPKRSPLGLNSPLSPTDGGEKEKDHRERGWFTFKLVPPAPGTARGVTFTAPRLHYFATDTKETGRAWMAAIMKATIEIDSTQPVTSSYSAATISLAKARALRARPPDLAIIKPPSSSTGGSSIGGDSNKGLAITGIDIDHDVDNDHHNGDADVEENGDTPSRSASRAGSHISTGTGSEQKFGSDSLNPSSKGFLGMSGAGDVRSLGSGSLRSPSLEKLLSGEEVTALNEGDKQPT